MIIHHKKSSIYAGLKIVILLSILIVATILEEGKFKYFYIIYIFLALYHISQAIYNWINPLVQIDKQSITFYNYPSKKQTYNLVDVHVDYKVGDYLFKTPSSKIFTIVKSSIPKSQLDEFESLIKDIHEKKINSANLVTS